MKIAVVGGGISGLCAAHKLVLAGHDVTCFEASERPGGLIRSERRDGFLCEAGPQSILDGAPEVRLLFDELDLTGRVCAPSAAAGRRMIFIDGKLRALPSGPGSLVTSDLLSAGAKWRLVREPSVRTPPPAGDESILDFAIRRAGEEVAHRIVAPATLGIFAGDAASLSVRSALPRVAALEVEHGSVMRGMKVARRQGIVAGRSVSFPEGLEELPRALAARLGDRLVRARTAPLRRERDGWIVERQRFDSVILALGPMPTADLIADVAPQAAAGLRSIRLASVVVVALGFLRADLGADLGAYGFLVARGERPTLLGCQYESTVFPGRAPAGAVLLRAILGGTFEPGVVELDEAIIIERTLSDLRLIMGIERRPEFTAVWRQRQALPQYELGHERRVRAIEAATAERPGLHLLTTGLRGVGLSDCIRNATALARTIGPSA